MPATRYPTSIEALTAIAPGDDWAIAVRSIISCSSIHPSSSTNFFLMSGIMTNPPPNVKALSFSVDRNSVRYLFFAFFPGLFSVFLTDRSSAFV